MNNNIMSAKETANYLRISYWLVLELVKRGQIPCSHFGNRIIFRKEALDKYIEQCEISSISQ